MKKEISRKIFSILIIILMVTMTFSFVVLSAPKAKAVVLTGKGCCIITKKGEGLPSQRYCIENMDKGVAAAECVFGEFKEGQECEDVTYTQLYGPDPCKVGVCVDNTYGTCQEGKYRVQCIANGGKWINAQTREQVEDCMRGCCHIAGVVAKITTKQECDEEAWDWLGKRIPLGELDDYRTFNENIISDYECKQTVVGADMGCCVVGGGNCQFITRKECGELGGEKFFSQSEDHITSCAQLTGEYGFHYCNIKSHVEINCGKNPGDEDKICWFDSQGNQEECLFDCGYPDGVCKTCRDKTCEDDIRKKLDIPEDKETQKKLGITEGEDELTGDVITTKAILTGKIVEDSENDKPPRRLVKDAPSVFVNTGYPFCQSTSCELYFEEDSYSQYWDCVETKMVDLDGDCIQDTEICFKGKRMEKKFEEGSTTELKSGQAMCYNMFWDSGLEPVYNKKGFGGLAEKPENAEKQFEYALERTTGLQSQIIHCSYGDIIVEGLGTDRNKICIDYEDDMHAEGVKSDIFEVRIKDNEWQDCSSCGENTRHPGMGKVGDYIGDAFANHNGLMSWLITPIISTQCVYKKCGSGLYDDSACCPARGDCMAFAEVGTWTLTGFKGVECVPIYPPGNNPAFPIDVGEIEDLTLEQEGELTIPELESTKQYCAACGAGGDSFWDFCTENECEALGNCMAVTPKGRGLRWPTMFMLQTCSAKAAAGSILGPALKLLQSPTNDMKIEFLYPLGGTFIWWGLDSLMALATGTEYTF